MKLPSSLKPAARLLSVAAFVIPITFAQAQTVIVDYEFTAASPAPTVGSSISSLSALGGVAVGGYDNWVTGSEAGQQRIFFNGVSGSGRSIDISLDATGYQDITLGSFFQLSARNNGTAVNWQLSYSTNGGSSFTQIGSDFSIVGISDGGGNSESSRVTIGADFSLGAAADDNPNIIFRINSAPGSLDFNGGTALGGQANFDNFSISGTAIPEPSSVAFLSGLLAMGLIAIRRRR